jgi:pimeloyl-ACP methyl ester carboxylesterase
MRAGFPEPEYADVNGIRLAFYQRGSQVGLPVVLCHGWPEIAYGWRLQIDALAQAGFRVMAPDMRGFGRSSGPTGRAAVDQYDVATLTADLVGLLDHLGIQKAVFAGHDWGGFVTWDMPLRHPERVLGVIGINTPLYSAPRLRSGSFPAPGYGGTDVHGRISDLWPRRRRTGA